MSKVGALLCARYAASPNFFGYCGPDKNTIILQRVQEGREDGEVTSVLTEFETLFPYLEIIAKKNGLEDCFDPRVVEAYWIGNSMLSGFTRHEYVAFLKEKLKLDYKLERRDFQSLMLHMQNVAPFPFHTFHVLHVFKRTGNIISTHTLETMENCRISWGKVVKKENDNQVVVSTPSLSIENDMLSLSRPESEIVSLRYGPQQFVRGVEVGDWVSFHWGLICDKLTLSQVRRLDRYTRLSIQLSNI